MAGGKTVITMKSAREIEIMRRSGKITSGVLTELLRAVRPGMTLREVDRMAERGIRERGGIPTFKGYHGFPASICASVNEVVVHGIPGDRRLVDGDILSIDIGTTYEGYVSDSGRHDRDRQRVRSGPAAHAGHPRVPHARDRADAEGQPALRHRPRRATTC